MRSIFLYLENEYTDEDAFEMYDGLVEDIDALDEILSEKLNLAEGEALQKYLIENHPDVDALGEWEVGQMKPIFDKYGHSTKTSLKMWKEALTIAQEDCVKSEDDEEQLEVPFDTVEDLEELIQKLESIEDQKFLMDVL